MDISTLTAIVPAQISFGTTMKYLAIFAAAAIAAGLLFRIFLGRRSALNRAICAGIGVLCVYVITVIVYTFSPGNLERFLVPLPFIDFSGDLLYLMVFSIADFPALCADVLSLVMLILIYNLVDNMLPDGESTITWLLLRTLTIVTAMVVHYSAGAVGLLWPDDSADSPGLFPTGRSFRSAPGARVGDCESDSRISVSLLFRQWTRQANLQSDADNRIADRPCCRIKSVWL